jgi:hypothetical protein
LADVAVGNALISGGVSADPSWGKIGLATHVDGTLPVANGGTNGTATPTAGAVAYGTGSAYAFSAAGTSGQALLSGATGAPTWGTLGLAAGGTGQTTAQAAINSLAGAVTSGSYLRGNGTNVLMSAIQAADVPTLNQNTTGSAATLTTGRTIAITGDLTYTSPSFNGSGNVTAAGTLATVNANVGSFTNASFTVNAKGLITAASSGTAPVTSVTGTSPVVSSGGATPAISLASGYGDTQNPYASKTAKFVLAAPTGTAGVPTFRAIVAADVPTLNQNTTGSAATLTTARTIQTNLASTSSASFNGSANITPGVTGTLPVANGGTGNTTAQAEMNRVAGAVTSGQYLRGNGTNVVMSAIQAADVPTLNQNTTGNAATATNLSTNRTNWSTNGTITAVVGQLAWKEYGNNHTIFDASDSTAPDGSAVNNTNAQAAWAGSYPTLMGWNGVNTYGVRVDSARVSDSAANLTGGNITGNYILSNATSPNTVFLQFGDNSGWTYRFMTNVSGTPTVRFSFTDTGNFTATANVTAFSDERYKTNWRAVTPNFVEGLAAVKSGVYDRTDQEATQAGVSAQSLQELLPETVIEDESGRLSVAYGNAALVACVELAKEVLKLRAEIEALKKQ